MSVLHRLGELMEPMASSTSSRATLRRERFVIGKEIVRLGKIGFGLLVVAAMDRVVGRWNRRCSQFWTNFSDAPVVHVRTNSAARPAGTTTEAVMSSSSLHFHRRMEILAQAERAPRAVRVETRPADRS